VERRTKYISLGALYVILFASIPVQAVVKVGGACPKLGKTSTVGKKIYTCTLQNKKLIWDQGKTIPKPKTSATPSPTAPATPTPAISPSSSPTPKGGLTPTSVALPDSWPLDRPADKSVVLVADAAVRRYISGATSGPKINLLTGPTTDRAKATAYLKYLEIAALGWSKDWKPDQVDVALAQVDDYEWIKPLWKEYGLSGGGFDDSEIGWRKYGSQCNQGSAIYATKPFFWGCLAQSPPSVIGLNKFGPHEYTHLAQNAIIYYQSGKKYWNLPFLFSEGSADFYGITFASSADSALENWNTYWINGYISTDARNELKKATISDVESLLIDSMSYGKKAPSHWYWTGAYATARIIAANGHDSFVRYMRKFGENGDALKSFESIYGLTFEKFASIIAPEIKELTYLLRN
jgi:hypothetical protein